MAAKLPPQFFNFVADGSCDFLASPIWHNFAVIAYRMLSPGGTVFSRLPGIKMVFLLLNISYAAISSSAHTLTI